MKFFVVFLALAMLVSVQGLTDEEKRKMTESNRSCLEESGVDVELVNKVKSGDLNFEDEKTKQFFLCLLKKLKIMDDEGNFHKAAVPMITNKEDHQKFLETIDPCLDKKGDTMVDIAWNYMKCVQFQIDESRKANEDY